MAYDFGAQWLARQFSQSTSREIAAFIATHVSSVCESNRRVEITSKEPVCPRFELILKIIIILIIIFLGFIKSKPC